jgi:hypothetical protein
MGDDAFADILSGNADATDRDLVANALDAAALAMTTEEGATQHALVYVLLAISSRLDQLDWTLRALASERVE